MDEQRRGGNRWGVAIGVLVVLVGLYVGAYYAMVTPEVGDSSVVPVYFIPGEWDLDMATGMRIHLWCRPFFSPMHAIDRRIRPRVWEPPHE